LPKARPSRLRDGRIPIERDDSSTGMKGCERKKKKKNSAKSVATGGEEKGLR